MKLPFEKTRIEIKDNSLIVHVELSQKEKHELSTEFKNALLKAHEERVINVNKIKSALGIE